MIRYSTLWFHSCSKSFPGGIDDYIADLLGRDEAERAIRDENRLHQDLYGTLHFPLQLAILLSVPGADFDGGEFVLTEQKPRMQSRVAVVPFRQGQGVVFPVQHRPGKGVRGDHRLTLRHGVSRIRRGARFTLALFSTTPLERPQLRQNPSLSIWWRAAISVAVGTSVTPTSGTDFRSQPVFSSTSSTVWPGCT